VCGRVYVHWSKASKGGEILFMFPKIFLGFGGTQIFIFFFPVAVPSPEPTARSASSSKNEEADNKSTSGSTSGREGEPDEHGTRVSPRQVKVHSLGVRV
jgi:hypothetical protein